MLKNRRSGSILASQSEWMNGPAENARGMLKFNSAPKSYAAIFRLSLGGIFPVVHTFGMKFRIDIALCDRDQKVLFFEANVEPNRLIVPWKYLLGGCRYLVEFSIAESADIQVGDELIWEAA